MTIDKIKKMEYILILLVLTLIRKQKYNKKLYFMQIKQNLVHFVYKKALIQIFHIRFFTANLQHKNTNSKGVFVFKNGFNS